MLQTIEIPRDRWPSYLDALNRRAAGHPVRVEVEDPELGSQEMARQLPLQEIGYEAKGSAKGSIDVRVGFDDGELLHRIAHPTHIWVAQEGSGRPSCVEIETEDAGKVLVWSEFLPGLPDEAAEPAPGP